MGKRLNEEMVKDAFALYLKNAGERFDLIEQEMHRLGWTSFKQSMLLDRKDRQAAGGMREGLINRGRWDHALKKHLAELVTSSVAATSAEKLLIECEHIRDAAFEEIKLQGVKAAKETVWQHKQYADLCIKILDKLEAARDNYANFVFFLKHLLTSAATISPALAKELCDAEEPLLEWAEKQFVIEDEKPEEP